MKRRCSIRLDLIRAQEQWAWRIFHRAHGVNESLAESLPFPQQTTPDNLLTGLRSDGPSLSVSTAATWGGSLRAALLPDRIVAELDRADGGDVLFVVPPEWADVPFELLTTEMGFLGERFRVGTIIQLDAQAGRSVRMSEGNNLAIVADPAANLQWAYREGQALKSLAAKAGRTVHFLSSATTEKLAEALSTAAVVHYAGHSEDTGEAHSSGWRIDRDVLFDLADIEGIGRAGAVPRLVFSNSCEAGGAAHLAGIAGAFLKAGVAQFLGPIHVVDDIEASRFAESFYGYLFRGMTGAQAMLAARQRMRSETPGSITPLLYRLFGDPCFEPGANVQRESEEPAPGPQRRRKIALAIVAVAAIIAVIILAAWLLAPQSGGNIIYIPAQ